MTDERKDIVERLAEWFEAPPDPAHDSAFECDVWDALVEIRRLREMLGWCARLVWDGCDIDGGSFQDKMEAAGLMVRVPADEAFRDEYDADEMLVLAWSRNAALNSGDGSYRP